MSSVFSPSFLHLSTASLASADEYPSATNASTASSLDTAIGSLESNVGSNSTLFLSTLSFNSSTILSAVFLPTPGALESLATSSLNIYAPSCPGDANDNIDKPTLGPYF